MAIQIVTPSVKQEEPKKDTLDYISQFTNIGTSIASVAGGKSSDQADAMKRKQNKMAGISMDRAGE